MVADLCGWPREHLGEPSELLERDSARPEPRAAAAGLLRRRPAAARRSRDAVRATGARVVHAHNLNPTLGWRALAAAREAGARTVLHLHNYRLVCAVGTCFTRGADCTRCHGRDTLARRAPELPRHRRGGGGVRRRRSRCGSVASPCRRRRRRAERGRARRLRELGAPLGDRAHVIASPQRSFAATSVAGAGTYALYAWAPVAGEGRAGGDPGVPTGRRAAGGGR